MESQDEMLERMYVDMYLGRGPRDPSITTRLSLQEDLTNRIAKNLSKLAWASILTFIAVIGEIIVKLIVK